MGNDVEAAFTNERTSEAKQSGDNRPFALAGLALLLGVVGVAVGSAGLAKANNNAADAKGAVAPASAASGGGAIGNVVVDNELPAESETVSKDPLAIVTREGDPTFSDFAYWVVNAVHYAEENGIDSANSSEMPSTFLFGPRYENMLIDAISAVGNHGDIYARHVESVYPRAGLNNLNEGGPKLYPYPGFSFAMEEGF